MVKNEHGDHVNERIKSHILSLQSKDSGSIGGVDVKLAQAWTYRDILVVLFHPL